MDKDSRLHDQNSGFGTKIIINTVQHDVLWGKKHKFRDISKIKFS